MPVEAAAGLRLTSLSKNWNDWKERGQGQRICSGKESARPRMSVQILVNGIVAEAHFAQDFIGCPNLPELRAQGTPAQAYNLFIAGLQSSRVRHGLTIRTS